MAEGYESLSQTRKRMQSLEEELDQRKLELGALTQRIDSLSRQAFAAKAASDALSGNERARYEEDDFEEVQTVKKERREDDRNRNHPKRQAVAQTATPTPEPVRAGSDAANSALEQLAKLTALISSQEQFIQQKKSMREQDQQIAKQQSAIEKSIDKLNRMHSAKLGELGCESEEQLLELLELKHEHEKLQKQVSEFNERIRAVSVDPFRTTASHGCSMAPVPTSWKNVGMRFNSGHNKRLLAWGSCINARRTQSRDEVASGRLATG